MEKNFVTDAQAQNATETTKTYLSGGYVVPQGAKTLNEIGLQLIPNGAVTDDEDISAILEVECDTTLSGWAGTQQFVTDVLVKKTSGAAVIPAKVHDCNVALIGGSTLKFAVTFNKALTTTPSWRVFGKIN